MFRRKSKRQDSIVSAPTRVGQRRSTNTSNSTSRQGNHHNTSLVGGSSRADHGGRIKIKTISFRTRSLPTRKKVRSVLKIVTNDDSLHSVYGSNHGKTPSDKPQKPKATVEFKELHIREYARTVGDNPSCSSGPPVGYVVYCYCWLIPAGCETEKSCTIQLSL